MLELQTAVEGEAGRREVALVGGKGAGFREFVAVEPDSPRSAFLLGMLALRSGRHAEALALVDEAIAGDAADPDFHYVRAAACRALGRDPESVASYREALRLRPGYPEALDELGAILRPSGGGEEAEASLGEAARLRPEEAQAQADLGTTVVDLGRAAGSPRDPARPRPLDAEALRDSGVAALREGRHADASEAFRTLAGLRPGDADARNDLGIALVRLGRLDEAIASYGEAIRLRPEFADARNNLGNALRNRGRLDEAIASLREALRLRPNYPEAHNNLGIALRAANRHDEAVASYQRALDLRPGYFEAHNNMGYALATRGRLEPAIFCYRQALRLKPDYFEAQHNMANALSDMGRHDESIAAHLGALRMRPRDARALKSLGIALLRHGKLEEAAARLREAITHHPGFADAHNDLGIVLARQGKPIEAIASYREAIRHRPNYPEAHNNLGNSLRNVGRFAESEECYLKAIQLDPDYSDAHNNYGIALAEMGRFDEAIAQYSECLRLRPNHVDAHMNRALTWLRKGDYAQGWAEYEWRWKKRNLTNRALIQPMWNGFPLAGRTILLITEQGFGDTIQFARYGSVLKAQGATVILECPERLIPLLRHCPGIDHLVAQGKDLPPYDVYAPLLTVAPLVDTSIESVPDRVPYIHPEEALIERWGRELAKYPGLKVGINWQGNPGYAGDYHRSIPLKFFEVLGKVPGVTLISLQKNHGMEQLPGIAGKFEVVELGSRLDADSGPFLDTAAVMKNLDLFITSDTAVAHLAGSLGVPTWMALSTAPDWRWMTKREDCAWYPSMRIFRQAELMEWGPVFARMASELRKLVPRDLPTRSVSVEVAPGELIDKITILEIKAARIADEAKRANVLAELTVLSEARDRAIVGSDGLEALASELRSVNETLWDVEDAIRECERAGEFGEGFIRLARSVYQTNDLRAELKRRINLLLGSKLLEEKSYAQAMG